MMVPVQPEQPDSRADQPSIFLVGLMGSGKSAIGRCLADRLGLRFVDSDLEIEERSGADIPWIFDVEGEQGFRDREEMVIDALTQETGIVLATGGGAILREANRRNLARRGRVVFLHAPIRELVRRTSGNTRRPLLAGKDPCAVLERLAQIREPLYREIADVEFESCAQSPRRAARELCALLERNCE